MTIEDKLDQLIKQSWDILGWVSQGTITPPNADQSPSPVMEEALSNASSENLSSEAVGSPFETPSELTQYVIAKYNQLGPKEGAQIQAEMNKLGYYNINDVKKEDYGALYQAVESLKVPES